MPPWLQWTLISAGLLTIVLLGLFIRHRVSLLRRHQRAQVKTQALQQERTASMIDSIRVLAMAIEQDQVEYSEACLRIKGLLDHVSPELLQQTPYRVFQDMHDALDHMPTHQSRQDTDPQFLKKMDEQRFALEKEHSDAIRRAATAIRHYNFQP